MESFLLLVATIGGMFAIVPLMIWGGSGSWRHAMHAFKVYLLIMLGLAVVGGGLGLLVSFGEHGFSLFS